MTTKFNGYRPYLYAGGLLVAIAGAFFATRSTAQQAAETAGSVENTLSHHLRQNNIHERPETKANRAHREMQKFYDNTIKPDLAAMESRLLRELQELKERIPR